MERTVAKTTRSNQSAVVLAAIFCALFVSSGTANASTIFDITGSSNYSGTITIDTVGGSITAADVVVTGDTPDFTNILQVSLGSVDATVGITNVTPAPPPTTGPILTLSIPDSGTLVGYAGGSIDVSVVGGCFLTSPFLCRGLINDLGSGNLTSEAAATPLPATLPLFATGLGVMGLFGWRKKRKKAAQSPN
jgi:hypothetical protein